MTRVSSVPSIFGFDYFAATRPARVASGDFIDYFELHGGNLGLMVGKVSGEGVPPALLTATLHSLVRSVRCAGESSLRAQVRSIDRMFTEVCPDHCYATLFAAEYDPATCRLHYVNAGHEPPIILRSNGNHFQSIFLEASGPMLGMLKQSNFREGVLTLRAGDLLAAYTDGLCDTTNVRGEEWGWPRFQEMIESLANRRSRDIVDGVLQAVDAFSGGAPQEHDATLWIGRVEGAAAEDPLRRMEAVMEPVAA